MAASTITGVVTFDGKAPALKPITMEADPGVRQEAHGARAERDAGARQRQHHGEHHGLGVEGAPGREDLARPTDAGHHRSEWLPVQAARDGDHGRPDLPDPQLRRHPPQHPRASQGQHPFNKPMPATVKETTTKFDKPEAELPGQVRRPPLDERLGGGVQPSLLLGDRHGREVHDLGPRPRDLRDHRVARAAGDPDGLGHRRRQRHQDAEFQVRRRPPQSSDPDTGERRTAA